MKRCEVQCLKAAGVILIIDVCGEAASFYQKGCLGAVGGAVFVCDKHRDVHQHRVEQSLDDYYVEHGERILGDNNLD